MADNVTNELLLEHLKAIQSRMTNLEHGQAEIKTTLIGMQQHMLGFMTQTTAHESAIANIHARLERIERRLEISDKV
ncbi:hypothetical protein [Martelella limonii]|uniref:hypothetical protein n=1 Tax=Martelella limonii TaxID=1647649 RepID=UPI001580808B|nr:hypothetical protein [Martelella limonii]